jgi:hypothetical protein
MCRFTEVLDRLGVKYTFDVIAEFTQVSTCRCDMLFLIAVVSQCFALLLKLSEFPALRASCA